MCSSTSSCYKHPRSQELSFHTMKRNEISESSFNTGYARESHEARCPQYCTRPHLMAVHHKSLRKRAPLLLSVHLQGVSTLLTLQRQHLLHCRMLWTAV